MLEKNIIAFYHIKSSELEIKMKRSKISAIIAMSILLITCTMLAGCDDKKVNKEDSRDIYAMDTYMSLKASGKECSKALDEAVNEINRLDKIFSVTNKNSEVYLANENGTAKLSDETAKMLEIALSINQKTKGNFDITIYPLVCEWGFIDKNYNVPSKSTIEGLLKNVGSDKIKYDKNTKTITLPEGVKIDFGGIAKGYASQRVMEIFKNYDLTGAVISLGGNVQTYGEKTDGSKYKIGIEDPKGGDEYIGIIEVDEKAVVTSGNYERFFEKDGKIYHHIINPNTGYPADNGVASVTVVCDNGTVADGLSTALFVMGEKEAIDFWRNNGEDEAFEIIIVSQDGTITVSEGLEDCFSTEKKYTVVKR